MIKVFTIILFFISLFDFSFAQTNDTSPLSGKLQLSINGAVIFPQVDYINPVQTPMGICSVDYYFGINSNHTFGIRFYGGLGTLDGNDNSLTPDEYSDDFFFFGGGLLYGYAIGDFVPYVFFGLTNLWYNPTDNNNNPIILTKPASENLSGVSYNYEAGLKFFLNENTSVNFSGGIFLTRNDLLDGKSRGTTNDAFIYGMVGISFAFSGEADSDHDGVRDSRDACPGTPRGVKVDSKGCPIDSDHDGVADYKDKCPGTPSGLKVDSIGCPIIENISSDTTKGIHYDKNHEYAASRMVYTDGKHYVVQISAWRTSEDAEVHAEKQVEQLKQKGYNAFIDTLKDKWNAVWYRVRIGYFNTFQEAESVAEKLK